MGTPTTSHINGKGLWSRHSPDKSELNKRLGRWSTGPPDEPGYKEKFLRYAQRYHELGWTLTLLNNHGTAEFEVDGGDDPEKGWLEHLDHLISFKGPVHLGIRTGQASRLIVLEVTPAGRQLLDTLGPWRSRCIAQAENNSEHHYFSLPEGYPAPLTLTLPGQTIKLWGEGNVVPAPPSPDPDTAIPWRWLSPPWESPPGPLSPALWQFLRDILAQTLKPFQAARPQPPTIEWGQYPLPKNGGEGRELSPADAQTLEYLKELTLSLYRQLHDSPKVAAFNAAMREHLEEHPEMAADLQKVEMLQYCLYTYCRIHPDFADFTIKERVQEASRMACQFLNQLHRYVQGYAR